MLEGFRNTLARGISILAQRVSSEPRYPNAPRVNTSPRTVAGVLITPDTAVTISAVWACIRYLSQTVAGLPWHVMEKVDGGSEIQDKNPIDYLLNERPNPEWSSFQFRETMTHWALRWGNGYAEIERDTVGRPIALWPIHPERVSVCREPETRRLYYEINNGADETSELDASDVFHVRGFGEGVVGVNAIHYAAQSLGWAKAAQTYGAAFFGNGAIPAVVVKNKKALSPAGLKLQREAFDELHKGPAKSHRSAHIDMDAEIEKMTWNAQETQIVEVHQFLVEEICRWFGVPPHKVMHLLRATFSNIEHQAIEVVVDSVTPWVRRFEDEAKFKLFGQNRRRLFTKMNMNALLRGDMQARMEYYKGRIQTGSMSPNEIRALEDENTIAEGDIYVMQEQMVPLEFISKRTDPLAESAPAEPDDSGVEDVSELFRVMNMEPANV
jgi:HK97 family phage portal protein